MTSRICIVTSGYMASTPRVVREADALSAAGFDVRVAFTQGPIDKLREFDEDLLRTRPWRTSIFRWSDRTSGERLAFHKTRLRHHLAKSLPVSAWRIGGIIERAEGRVYPELVALAKSETADLFIGHYPDGLAAAAQAARQHNALLGYDVEDLYPDCFTLTPKTAKARERILGIERRYVHRCVHVSAVSRPVAEAFAVRFNRELPLIVHNCHAWAERNLDGRTVQRQGSDLSLYWFSQTVGLNRGIQDAIRAAGLLSTPVQIHLQGTADGDVVRELQHLAAECGRHVTLRFHGPVPPDELPSRAAEHDIGLALETDETPNRRLAVTNKQFLYLLAGIAIVASDIPGQRSIMDTCPDAGVLYRCRDFQTMASHLQAWIKHPAKLAAAKRASLEAARTRWNWEHESEALVATVDRLFNNGAVRKRIAG
jgi:glycosyltransferase involved in cell wall biosynthesis